MKKPITTRTVNYEIQLLRGVMIYADCWTDQLHARYKPLRQVKSRVGKTADKAQLVQIIATAKTNDYWQLAMYCAAVAVGRGELRDQESPVARHQSRTGKNHYSGRSCQEPEESRTAAHGARGMGSARVANSSAGTRCNRATALSVATESQEVAESRQGQQRKVGRQSADDQLGKILAEANGRLQYDRIPIHDLRHTFRTLGAEAGVPLEVMMAQLGHMDRETSLDYVHIQQRALERAKQLIESEQKELLSAAQGKTPQKRVDSAKSTPTLTLAPGDALLRR